MDHLENVNDKTRELILNIEKDMEKMLSSFRLNHCKYVMYKAVELANIYYFFGNYNNREGIY